MSLLISWFSHSWTKRPLYRWFLVIITVVFFSAMKNLLGLTLLDAYDIVKTNCSSGTCVVWASLKQLVFTFSDKASIVSVQLCNNWINGIPILLPSNKFNVVKFSFFNIRMIFNHFIALFTSDRNTLFNIEIFE